jgi:hypothetical protein
MNQNDFHRAVAEATGESIGTIAHRGFGLLRPVPFEREPRRPDFDEFLEGLSASKSPRPKNPAAA